MLRTLTIGLALAGLATTTARAADESKPRVFELRTYHTNVDKLNPLHKRFRDHTLRMFKKHHMEVVGFWTPQDKGKEDTLIYMLAFPSREAATAAWKAFGADPEWLKAREESHKNGVLVKKVESVFLDPTDYSPIR
jgi:hypothetical protein